MYGRWTSTSAASNGAASSDAVPLRRFPRTAPAAPEGRLWHELEKTPSYPDQPVTPDHERTALMPRTQTYFVGASIDGYIARPHG